MWLELWHTAFQVPAAWEQMSARNTKRASQKEEKKRKRGRLQVGGRAVVAAGEMETAEECTSMRSEYLGKKGRIQGRGYTDDAGW